MPSVRAYGPSLIVLLTAVLVLVAGPHVVKRLTYAQTQARIVVAGARLDQADALQQLNQAYRDIATLVEPSVVHISAESFVRDRFGEYENFTAGSGWIYDVEGHIVTNAHVVRDAHTIDVQLHTGELRRATVVGRDLRTDIAVIKIASGQLHPARQGLGEPARQGDVVFAFGSPFDFRFSMSSGIISGLGRFAGLAEIDYENFIQVDAAINPGNSGGPLTDIYGRVIGMNTAIATARPTRSLEEGQFGGIGLAIPISMIASVVQQLIETGTVERGYLGVNLLDIENKAALAIRRGFRGQGVEITRVVGGSPADEAGLHVNDVITRIDDEPVRTVSQVSSTISSHRPGEDITVAVWRYGDHGAATEELSFTLTLAKLNPEMMARHWERALRRAGLDALTTSTEAKAAELNVDFHSGVLVEHVGRRSAYDGLIEAGSIIVAVEGHSVENLDEFYTLVARRSLPLGVSVELITPRGKRNFVPLVLR